jgi:hypothetical protein
MTAVRQLQTEFGAHYTASAICRITRNPNFQVVFLAQEVSIQQRARSFIILVNLCMK